MTTKEFQELKKEIKDREEYRKEVTSSKAKAIEYIERVNAFIASSASNHKKTSLR